MNSTGKNILTYLVTLLFFIGFIQAQDEEASEEELGTLQGVILDKEGQFPLIGATVQIMGTYLGGSADLDGKYVIPGIKPGDYNVKVSYIGYADKIYTGISIEAGKTKEINIELEFRSQTLDAVTIVGEKTLVNLESGASEVKIDKDVIQEMNVRNVEEVVSQQAGVTKTPDGLVIRGGRVYETQYMVDGVNAQDPLAGTGFGVQVSSSSIDELQVITGGAGAEYGDGTAGVISTTIRSGGKDFEIGGSWQRDNLGFNQDANTSFNTDIVELMMGGPLGKSKKLTYFISGNAAISDNYFGATANQLHSSLFPANDSLWAPRYDNTFSNTIKIAYELKPGTRFSLTNQHSLRINQNTRTLQIVGFDAILAPGYQYRSSLQLDNATTYTHHSNLTILNFNHFFNNNWNLSGSAGRLFTNLRADANGREFRPETIDEQLDQESIVTDPVELFNPDEEITYVLPGPWLYNNGGISGTWHDHYVQEYTIKYKIGYYPKNGVHKLTFGQEQKIQEYQWVDVYKPWVGAPIQINDSVTSPATSVGSSSDIWKVKPFQGGIFLQDVITYKGVIATLGLRFNYWANGKFADDAVANPESPVIDQVREDYMDNTFGMFGLRWKARLLPKINVSFPITDNNVLYFNYGHSMRLPHPRFIYQGLDPVFANNAYLSNLGNPDLNPEVSVNYELGMKTQLNKNLALTLSAYNNNRFDYIVSRKVLVEDVSGRQVSKQMYINQDYAKIMGVEVGARARIKKYYTLYGNITYQSARGKSNSARESSLQIEQTGDVPLTSEQYLAWDRPWDIKAGFIFSPDTTFKIGGKSIAGFRAFVSANYTSGFRYTPQRYVGVNDLGRPLYDPILDQYLANSGASWFNVDMKLSYDIFTNKEKRNGFTLSLEFRNLTNHQNAQVVNAVTGRAWEPGDDVTQEYRDPRYVGPEENGKLPDDPARYTAPFQLIYGISFKF